MSAQGEVAGSGEEAGEGVENGRGDVRGEAWLVLQVLRLQGQARQGEKALWL